MKSRVKSFVVLGVICSALSGCIAVPFIAGYKEMGFSKDDRMRLFEEELKEYSHALSDGRPSKLASFVPETKQNSFRRDVRAMLRERKIVDSKIDLVEFDKDAQTADADIIVRYYRIPQYVVKEEYESQKWEFSVSDGWKLVSREVEQEGEA
jgi:hypothetical protein